MESHCLEQWDYCSSAHTKGLVPVTSPYKKLWGKVPWFELAIFVKEILSHGPKFALCNFM